MGKEKKLGLDEQIAVFTSRGWIAENIRTGPHLYYFIGPSGRVFEEEQTLFNNCPICDPLDEDPICIHDEKDLAEGEEARKFADLIRNRDRRELFNLLYKKRP